MKQIELYGDGIGSVEYVNHMGEDLTVVNSARVSFGVEKDELEDKDKKLIKYLIKHKHTSTLEHCVVTFRFTVPLFIRSQHHRHRTWSYNEISRRYTEFGLQFYEPEAFRSQHKSNRQASTDNLTDPKVHYYDINNRTTQYDGASLAIKNHHAFSLELFNDLIKAGVCREQARGILPQNLYTQYYGTANLGNLLKFVDLRIHEGAQWEIQQVAKAILKILEELYPITVSSYQKAREGP